MGGMGRGGRSQGFHLCVQWESLLSPASSSDSGSCPPPASHHQWAGDKAPSKSSRWQASHLVPAPDRGHPRLAISAPWWSRQVLLELCASDQWCQPLHLPLEAQCDAQGSLCHIPSESLLLPLSQKIESSRTLRPSSSLPRMFSLASRLCTTFLQSDCRRLMRVNASRGLDTGVAESSCKESTLS